MRRSTRVRRTLAVFAAAALVVTGTLTTASAANAADPPPPVVVAALGDSITTAAMTCGGYTLTCPTNSWSTGSNAAVLSHTQRMAAAGVPVGAIYNNAVSGSLSGALKGQADKAVAQLAQYVTIEIGANDACTRTFAAMTPVAVFRANVESALIALKPTGAKVYIAGIPSLKQLYDVNAGSSTARLTWSLFKICQSMLANPSSTKSADVTRRANVQMQVDLYNAQLADLCKAGNVYNCRYDGTAATYKFVKTEISTRDYFHPSLTGQATLARLTWPNTQWVKP